jgi:Xaa-Pro aminopeptidase
MQIAIDSAIFPKGTTGAQLDVLARKNLWQDGLNYAVSLCMCFLILVGILMM